MALIVVVPVRFPRVNPAPIRAADASSVVEPTIVGTDAEPGKEARTLVPAAMVIGQISIQRSCPAIVARAPVVTAPYANTRPATCASAPVENAAPTDQ